jgi:23S rRNA pseudouridine955/2504/2580 synthase
VVGDDRYGVTELNGWRPLPGGRPFLHAAAITFEHPSSGEPLHFSAPVPEDLLSVLASMVEAV